MKLTIAQKWLRTIAWLRRNFPGQHSVYIRSTPIRKYHGGRVMKIHGYAEYSKSQFNIRIESKSSFLLRIDTLIHEWAHVLTWFGAETDIEDHSSEWGIQYAKIYRTFIEWNFGREESSDD